MAKHSLKRSLEWKIAQQQKKREEARKRREQQGYNPDDYRQKDSERRRKRASGKSRAVYKDHVRKYEEFLQEEKNMPDDHKVGEEYPTPTLERLKEFIRWYAASTKGRLAKNGRPTRNSTLNWAQKFVAGFYLVTGNEIPKNDSSAFYEFIENELVEEGFLSTVTKPLNDFGLESFERTFAVFWTSDDACFMPGRHRVQFHFITLQFLCSAARVSHFTPSTRNENEDQTEDQTEAQTEAQTKRGLRYKDIQLVLLRTERDPWIIGWRLDQRFVKGNKDPDNTVFGTAIWDCDEPMYSGAIYLLALALADGALFHFKSAKDVFEQRIPEGENEMVLRWEDEALERCVVRSVTGEGVSEDPLTQWKYQADLSKILRWAGYSITATVHAMRRFLGKKIAAKYTPALVAQLLTHRSEQIYGDNYLASCSGVDVVNAMRGNAVDNRLIDYLQGYEQFHENGLPHRLPFEEQLKLEEHPDLVAIDRKIENAALPDEKRRLQKERGVLKRQLHPKALRDYHDRWVRERRDRKITSGGRERTEYIEEVAEKQTLEKIMPELGRLTGIMSRNKPLSFHEKASVVEDLHTHCLRDFSVVYLPGEDPVEGRCPVENCKKDLQLIQRSSWSSHIHVCRQREHAEKHQIPFRKVKYCWECYTFHDGTTVEFEKHCESHLPSMTNQHYEVMLYRNTRIRAGYCIECLWDATKSASSRMSAFNRSNDLRDHLEGHIEEKKWPSRCADPLCHHLASDEVAYRRHLHDAHRYHKTICLPPEKTCKKRSSSTLDETFTTGKDRHMEPKRHCKRQRIAPKSPHGEKELRFKFWEPSSKQPRSLTPAMTEKKTQDEDCRRSLCRHETSHFPSTVVSDIPQDSYSSPSVSLDPPGLIDDESTRLSHSSVSPDLSAVPIDQQILHSPPPFVCQPAQESGQHVTSGSENYGENHCVSDPTGTNASYQEPLANPTQGVMNCQDTAIFEAKGTLIDSTLPTPPSQPVPGSTSSESASARGVSHMMQLATDIQSREKAGNSSRPITRAQARALAQSHHKPTDLRTSSPKSISYSQEEDLLLKKLMKKWGSLESATPEFQKTFPCRTARSLRKRWSLIHPPPRRSTRSRLISKSV